MPGLGEHFAGGTFGTADAFEKVEHLSIFC